MSPKTNKLSLNRVAIIYKRSVYQKYIMEKGHEKMQELMDKKNITTRSVKKAHDQHTKTLSNIIKVVESHGIKYDLETRHNIKTFKGYDLIITVGGDGTFLRTSHHVKDQHIIGINSAPKHSVGATCSITHDQFSKKFNEILAGNFTVSQLTRIQTCVNSKPLPILSTNDILFTNLSPAATSRYFMKFGRSQEEQKSSGVWIATPLGSTAAMKAAGGQVMPWNDKRLEFITREPYQGIYNPYKLIHGYVGRKQKLKIISKMFESRVYIDGPMHFFDLHYGDVIEFSCSKHTLNVIQ